MNSQSSSQPRPLRGWFGIACCLGLIVAAFVQWQTTNRLHLENERLRTQSPQKLTEKSHRADTADAVRASELARARKERLELLELRGEVTRLREQEARGAFGVAPASFQPTSPELGNLAGNQAVMPGDPHHVDEIKRLTDAIMNGDPGALDALGKLSMAAHLNTNDQAAVFGELRTAFKAMGNEAGNGNKAALQAIWQATRIKSLTGFAVHALGDVAGKGNQEALEPLLNPDAYLISRSSAVGALKPAADTGNPRAIQSLADVVVNPSMKPLWYMAASGLETAATTGNATAIDALALIAADENRNVREKALFALEAAARGKQARAEEALRKLGWR